MAMQKKKRNWGTLSRDEVMAQLKKEILEHVRALSTGRVSTVYPIIERDKELRALEDEAAAEAASVPAEPEEAPAKTRRTKKTAPARRKKPAKGNSVSARDF